MRFIIQNDANFDFIWAIEEAIKFHEWYNDCAIPNFRCNFSDLSKFAEEGDTFIPIGSVEFVHKAMKIQTGNNRYEPNQINIPSELMTSEFCGRKCFNIINEEFTNKTDCSVFYKSLSKVKGEKGVLKPNETLKEGSWFISELVEFYAEYRGFVLDGRLLDIRLYLGDYRKSIDFAKIDKMINKYGNKTYTIDVGIIGNDTFLIEIHRFYSCGLYGFCTNNKLLTMLERGYSELLELYKGEEL